MAGFDGPDLLTIATIASCGVGLLIDLSAPLFNDDRRAHLVGRMLMYVPMTLLAFTVIIETTAIAAGIFLFVGGLGLGMTLSAYFGKPSTVIHPSTTSLGSGG
jgi:hypothetical protein